MTGRTLMTLLTIAGLSSAAGCDPREPADPPPPSLGKGAEGTPPPSEFVDPEEREKQREHERPPGD